MIIVQRFKFIKRPNSRSEFSVQPHSGSLFCELRWNVWELHKKYKKAHNFAKKSIRNKNQHPLARLTVSLVWLWVLPVEAVCI